MRESPWRGFAPSLLLASALLALGACRPPFDLNNAPPPCINGYSPCPMTGICQPNDPDAQQMKLVTDGPLVTLPLNCPSTLTVRQSSSVFLPAPGVRLEDITVETLTGETLTATPAMDHGRVGVTIEAPPGTPLGDELVPLYQARFITMKTKVGAFEFDRTVLVIVSPINAGPGGDDSNEGLLSSPFATFRRAAEVAQQGDTINLGNVSDTDNSPVLLRSGVTVTSIAIDPQTAGNDVRQQVGIQVALPMEIDLAGDATLQGLNLSGSRLVIDVPGSHVILNNVTDEHGLTVSSKASVLAGATGTKVEIVGQSSLTNRYTPSQSPLLVQADGANVIIDSPSTAVTTNVLGTNVETIHFDGAAQSLTVGAGVNLANLDEAPVIHLVGSTTLSVDGARFIDPLLIDDPASDAVFQQAIFSSAPLTFKGHNLTIRGDTNLTGSLVTFQGETLQLFDTTFSGGGIVQSAPAGRPDVVSTAQFQTTAFKNAPVTFGAGELTILSGTTFENSLLTFHGTKLAVSDATFSGQGIEQDAMYSTSTLERVTISDYAQFGYHLLMGKVAITDSSFAHDVAIVPSIDGTAPPWALQINATATSDSSVSSQGTQYDGLPFAPQPCDVYGPNALGALYSISNHVELSFCN